MRYKDKYALITDKREKVTYSALDTMIHELTKCIMGNRLALIIMNNDLGAVVFYLLCLKAGIVPIIVEKNASAIEIQQYIQQYEPEYILTLKSNMTIQSVLEKWSFHPIKEIFRHTLYEKGKSGRKKIHKDLAILLPTSGTTHVSKLVRISRENLNDNAENICEALKIQSDDIAVTSLPLSYTYGLSVLNTHLFKHATVLLTDKSVLQKSFWELVDKYKVTSFAGVPYTYELLQMNGHLEKENPIKVYTQAGGRLSPGLQKIYTGHCIETDKKFFVMYGQTEATARMSVLQMEDAQRKTGSVGKAIPGGTFFVEKNRGSDQDGEIIYSGKNVCMGYCSCLEDLELGDVNEGSLRTGDFGYLDEDGFLYITGRKGDFIKKYGRRINLNSISQMIEEIWEVKTCCTYKNNLIVIVYEEKSRNRIPEIQRELYQRLHLRQSDFSYYGVDHFERTYNGKIHLGGKSNGKYI